MFVERPRLAINEHGRYEVRWHTAKATKRKSLKTTDPAIAQERFARFMLGQTQQRQYTVGEAWQLRSDETLNLPADPQRIRDAWKALLPFFGALQLAAVTSIHVSAYTAQRIAAGRVSATVRRELVELRACLMHLVATHRVARDTLPYIALPPPSAARPFCLTAEQSQLILAGAQERREQPERPTRLELFLHIGLHTGQRKRAIEHLHWSQVSFDHDVVHFAKQGERVTRKRKGDVPMRATLRTFLLQEYQARETDYVLRFPGSIRTAFENLMRRLNLSHVTPHTLRHTFVSDLLMRGVDVLTVATLVGVSVAQVERTYGHLSKPFLRAAIEKVATG